MRTNVSAHIPLSERHEITFRNLTYSIPLKKEVKPILRGVTARLRPGRLTVILGSSGAGKTSLLNVLSGEATMGTLSGDVFVNGESITGEELRKLSAYVYQEDVVMDTMTVREAITMSAQLRIPTSVSQQEREQRVKDIISLMHLNKAADTMLGSSMVKGVSGGEKKRACIAMELVTNPPILFLDEPTSGLDTYSAYTTVKFLKQLADSGRTVVATLHQPSSDIFHMIDDMILMAEGRVMYCGPAKSSISYFDALGYSCPRFSNPADFLFMNVLTGKKTPLANDQQGDELSNVSESTSMDSHLNVQDEDDDVSLEKFPTRSDATVTFLLDAWLTSKQGQALHTAIDQSSGDPTQIKRTKIYRAGFWTQFPVLTRRAFFNTIRNPLVVAIKVIQVIILAAVVNIIYWQIPTRNANSQIQDRAGAIFFVLQNLLFGYSVNNLSVFAAERQVFQREYRARLYGLPAYFLSKTLVEIPYLIITPLLYALLYYFGVGFQLSAGNFFVAVVLAILVGCCGNAIGLWAAFTFPTLDIALAMTPLIVLPLMVFGGLFVNLGGLPAWISWFKWLSPIKYGFVAFMRSEFDGLVLPKGCDPTVTKCISGDQVLEQFGIDDQGGIAINILALVVWFIVGWMLAYLGLTAAVRRMSGKVKHVTQVSHQTLLAVEQKA
jgi:ATP-binding cassette subfamily G (WHITE) protein 1